MKPEKNNKNKNNSAEGYVSLTDATKLCSYSQEYLSLRARQGKLKALKLGRNWVTKKEWLKDYEVQTEEYKNYVNNQNHVKEKEEKIERVLSNAPDNLPIEKFRLNLNFKDVRPILTFSLVFVLLIASSVFGKESLLKSYNEIAQYAEKIDQQIEVAAGNIVKQSKILGQNIEFTARDISLEAVNYKDGLASVSDVFNEYSDWMKENYNIADQVVSQKIGERLTYLNFSISVPKISMPRIVMPSLNMAQKISSFKNRISEIYSSADNFVSLQVVRGVKSIGQSYVVADKQVEKKILEIAQDTEKNFNEGIVMITTESSEVVEKTATDFKKVKDLLVSAAQRISSSIKKNYQLAVGPWRGGVKTDELEELKNKMDQLEKNPVVVKRIEVSKVVEPIKEITREVETIKQITKVDDSALAEVRDYMSYLEGEIGKRLYAPGGVVSQTIYVTEPVSSPKIYQENGEIVLQTLGSGNVILSAATGLQLYGQQVVIESTNTLNPMIYLASRTRIDGDATITGATNISGNLGVGGTFSSGAATVTGGLTVIGDTSITGDLTIIGNENITGVRSITASSTSAVLTVSQTGSGDILNLFDGSSEVFTVVDGGNVGISTTTPSALFSVQGNIMGSGNMVLYGNTTSTIGWGFTPSADADVRYSLGSPDYRWSNIYAATTTIGGTIVIDTDDIRATGLLTVSATDMRISASAGDISATSSNDIYFATDGTERMRILSSGNIAIATSTTNYDLAVYGRTNLGNSLYTEYTTIWETSIIDSVGDVGPYNSLYAVDANTIFVSYYDNTNDDLIFAKSTDGGSNWTTSTVDTAGNVGINGTTIQA
ncbi:MAG: hypothetical protein ABIH76_07380, partial [Candidatus Bathyarchaeota archaeon]